jgi:hypothetical protein
LRLWATAVCLRRLGLPPSLLPAPLSLSELAEVEYVGRLLDGNESGNGGAASSEQKQVFAEELALLERLANGNA